VTRIPVSRSVLGWAIEQLWEGFRCSAKVSEGAGVGAGREPPHLATARKAGQKRGRGEKFSILHSASRGLRGILSLVSQRLVKTSVG